MGQEKERRRVIVSYYENIQTKRYNSYLFADYGSWGIKLFNLVADISYMYLFL